MTRFLPKAPQPVEDPRALVPFGWAPGSYMNQCFTCEEYHLECDKRARRCQDCAEDLKRRMDIARLPQERSMHDHRGRRMFSPAEARALATGHIGQEPLKALHTPSIHGEYKGETP